MAYDETLAQRIRSYMETAPGYSERKMFGGIAFMVNGNMCCGVIGDELMVRVGPGAYDDALALPHAREMDFTGRPMKGYVTVETAGLGEDADLEHWIDRGFAFTAALPVKPPR